MSVKIYWLINFILVYTRTVWIQMGKYLKNITIFFFRLFCILLFSYQMLFVCLDSFINQKPVTKTLRRRQEAYPRPLICISAFQFDYTAFMTQLNITFEEYRKGLWKLENISEETSFDLVAPNLYELIRKTSICCDALSF